MPSNRWFFIKYGLQFAGWAILFLLVTEAFTRLAVVSSPPFPSKVNGGGVEIYGIEGYGIIYYRPNMEIVTPYSGGDNIVTLGDSYTQARHSLFWKNYSSVAESELRSSGHALDVRNFGYMASALPYYIGIGDSLSETYHPKLVVIQIAANDFISERVFDPTAPFYFKFEAGELVVASSKQAKDYLKLSSRLQNPSIFSFSSRSSVEAYLKIQHGQKTQTPDNDAEPRAANVASRPTIPITKEELIARELSLIERTYGDTPILFVFRPLFSKQRLEFYYDKDVRRLITLVQQHPSWHALCLDIAFNQSFQQGYSPLGFGNTNPFSGHWNARGHGIAGKAIAEKIIEVLNSEGPPSQTNPCVFE